MIAQHYKIEINEWIHADLVPGSFVHEEDSDEICGFVDFVSEDEMAIMLFEPDDLTGFPFTLISEKTDYRPRLLEILEEDPEMKKQWLDTLDDFLEDIQ